MPDMDSVKIQGEKRKESPLCKFCATPVALLESVWCRGGCNKIFHRKCAQLGDLPTREELKNWKCNNCMPKFKETQQLMATEIEKETSMADLRRLMESLHNKLSEVANQTGKTEIRTTQIEKQLNVVLTTVEDSLQKIEDLQTSVTSTRLLAEEVQLKCHDLEASQRFMAEGIAQESIETSRQFHSLRAEIVETQHRVGIIEDSDVAAVRAVEILQDTVSSSQYELSSLRTENTTLKSKLLHIEVFQRKLNLEVHGLQTQADEDPIKLVLKIGELIGEPMVRSSVQAAHRIFRHPDNKSVQPKVLLIKFLSQAMVSAWMGKIANLPTSDAVVGGGLKSQLYFNLNYPPELRTLFLSTRKIGKKLRWNRVWVSGSGVLFRRTFNEPPTLVHDLNSLQQYENEAKQLGPIQNIRLTSNGE